MKRILKTTSFCPYEQTIQFSTAGAMRFLGLDQALNLAFSMNIIPQPEYQATVGIDWADQKHDLFVRFADGRCYGRQIAANPECLQQWLFELRISCAPGKIAIALEQRRGALFYQLCSHLDWVDLYPINPESLSSFRKAFFCSRAKSDPIDSRLLEELLRTHGSRLRPYRTQPGNECLLDRYCRQRRNIVQLATRIESKLISNLKQYFPLAVQLFAEVGFKSDIALSFISRWPSLHGLQTAKPHTLRNFFYAHNSRSEASIQKRLCLIEQAFDFNSDLILTEPFAITTRCLVAELRHLKRVIAEFDLQIQELFQFHPDSCIFKSFPGAGKQLAPRLLIAFGSDRSRWPDCSHLQRYSGIAPVIERSGNSFWVHRRFGRPKFLCQTFHEFAQHSILHCPWARQYYQAQRKKGKTNHSSIRALAFKWIRILFACWKHRQPYDESRLSANRSAAENRAAFT